MLEQQALVLALDQQQAQVEVIREKPCAICGQTRGCGVSIWGRLFGHQSARFYLQNSLQAQVGDHIIIGVAEGAVMMGAWIAYGLPLLLLLLGAIVGTMMISWSAASDINTIIGAALGLMISLLIQRVVRTVYQQQGRYQVSMLRMVNPITTMSPTQSHPINAIRG